MSTIHFLKKHEVGANIGTYTVVLADAVGPGGFVYLITTKQKHQKQQKYYTKNIIFHRFVLIFAFIFILRYAFEPFRKIFQIMTANVALNGLSNVQTYQVIHLNLKNCQKYL